MVESAGLAVRFTKLSDKLQRKSLTKNPQNDAEPWEGDVDDLAENTKLLISLGC
jgi:hypothetical protein